MENQWSCRKLKKVGVDPLDNIDYSIVIYGLHYQTEEALWKKLNRMLSVMGEEPADLYILKCKRLSQDLGTDQVQLKLLPLLSMIKSHAWDVNIL